MSLDVTLVVAAQIMALILVVFGLVVEYANHLERVRGNERCVLFEHQMQTMSERFYHVLRMRIPDLAGHVAECARHAECRRGV